MSLTVVSHNVFGAPGVGGFPARAMKICAGIAEQNPDVVMLQELYTWRGLELFRDGLPDLRYPAYVRSRIGPAAALVVLSRRPLTGTRYIPFSTRRRDTGKGYRKGILSCEIDGVRFVNFHFSSNPKARWHSPNPVLAAQARQACRLAAFVNELGNVPMVVAGDSNIDRKAALFSGLMDESGLSNPFDSDASPTLCGPPGVAWCVDCILLKGWSKYEAETSHLFTGQTARWTQAARWKRLGVVSDHEGLRLTLSGE